MGKTIGVGIKVQGAFDKRVTAAFRGGFVKLNQPWPMVRAAAAAADTARPQVTAAALLAATCRGDGQDLMPLSRPGTRTGTNMPETLP